jgi:hypothetical protein
MAEEPNYFGNIGSRLGGLLFGGPSETPEGQTPDAMSMLSEQERRRLMFSTLGQLGATLLAAGQKQMPAQRAQILGQLGNIGPNLETGIFRAQQARLMGAQMQEKMREMEQNKALSEWAKNPENLGKIGMTPEQFNVLGVSGIRSILQAQASRDPIQVAAAQAQLADRMRQAEERKLAVDAINKADLTEAEKAAALANPMEWVKTQIKPSDQFVQEPQKGPDGQPVINPNTGMPVMVQRNTRTGEIKAIGGGGVTINQHAGETEEQKVLGKARGEAQTALRDAAAKAPDNIAKLNLLGDLTAGVKTGATANVQGQAISLAKAAGVSDETIKRLGGDPNLPATAEAINKVVNELTVGLIGPGGFPANSFSNADREFLEKIFPSIRNQPEANQIAIEVMKRTEMRKAQKQAEWRAYSARMRAEGKKANFDDFEDEYVDRLNAQEKEGNSLFAGLAELARPFSGQTKPAGNVIDFGSLR